MEIDKILGELAALSEQKVTARQMQALLQDVEKPFARTTYPAHFTASAFIYDPAQQKVLLTLHRKLKLYLQPGGHIEEGETPLEASLREGLEESGLTFLTLVSPLPFDIDIHTIPATTKEPEHQHYDICYLYHACSEHALHISEESLALTWFCLKDTEQGEARVARMTAKLATKVRKR